MEITEAKIKLVSDKADKLKAFCTITIDHEFVIRDIKIIKGAHGYFVAMPSRKLMDRCPSCGGKNQLRASYCNDCGGTLRPNRVPHDAEGRAKLHADIAHPINSACRERLQRRVIEAYEAEVERSRQPGYVPPPDEDFAEDIAAYTEPHDAGRARPEPGTRKPEPPKKADHPESSGPTRSPQQPSEEASFGSGIL